jgi:Protein of unknown function (DUF3618)
MSTHRQTPEELRKEVDATRRELGATVEALAAKTAVKARLRDPVEHVRDELKRTLERRSVQAVTIAGTAIVLVTCWSLLRRTD